MVQRHFRIALGYAVLGFAALGCGSSDSSSSKKPILIEAPRVTGSAASLNLVSSSSDERLLGLWKSDCLANGDGSSSTLTVEITENYFQQTTSLFRGLDCIGLAMDARFITSYEARDGQLKTTLKQAHVQVYNRLFTQAAEAGSSCGFNHWQTNVWYDLTNRVCVKSENGIWITPTQAGTKSSSNFAIFVSSFMAELDLGGVTLKRPKRDSDVAASTPVDPVNGFLFADRKAQAVETFLKNWGCVKSLELGVSECPAPQTLDDASQLIDHLIDFGHAINGDVNFKDKKEAQEKLRKGYHAEMFKVHAFPAYDDVARTLREGLEQLQREHPKYEFSDFFNVNALKAVKGLKTMREAFDVWNLEQELTRLGVNKIYASDSASYGGTQGDIFLMWDDTSSAQEMMKYLQERSPVSASPGSVSSLLPQVSHGLGYEAAFAQGIF